MERPGATGAPDTLTRESPTNDALHLSLTHAPERGPASYDPAAYPEWTTPARCRRCDADVTAMNIVVAARCAAVPSAGMRASSRVGFVEALTYAVHDVLRDRET